MLTTPLSCGPRSMRERTEMLGGDLRVDTGSGTRASAVGAAETNAAAGNNVAANFDAARHCTTVQW
jgi:signal transduction histidine kinase